MNIDLFDYDLPESAIAQVPTDQRDQSRLLVIERQSGQLTDARFSDLPSFIENNTRTFIRNTVAVLPARLRGVRSSGGAVECLLLEPTTQPNCWTCLIRPGKKLPVGSEFQIGPYTAQVVKKSTEGTAEVFFDLPPEISVPALAREKGEIPLPPYIRRMQEDALSALDKERYQTVYADPDEPFAAAAPTAGLHFTPELNSVLNASGHRFADLVLNVGLGTFRPIQTDTVEAHVMHGETYRIPQATRQLLRETPASKRLCVGTTALRASEDYFRKLADQGDLQSEDILDEARLFIYPPAQFHSEGLITNFHLPRSTLLCLVSAFLTPGSTEGIGWLMSIYKRALDKGYRFYSYGDAMLIID